MVDQLLLDVRKYDPRMDIVLHCKGTRYVSCKSVKMTDYGFADLFVRNGSRPKVWWRSAGDARDPPKR